MKIIFLDVDGVLYPYHDRKLLTQKPENIIKKLIRIDRFFNQANALELQLVYEGWNKQAVSYVKRLVEETDAKIVISSSWKYLRSLEDMKLLFKIYDLDSYVIGLTKDTADFLKETQIEDYIHQHNEIEK